MEGGKIFWKDNIVFMAIFMFFTRHLSLSCLLSKAIYCASLNLWHDVTVLDPYVGILALFFFLLLLLKAAASINFAG